MSSVARREPGGAPGVELWPTVVNSVRGNVITLFIISKDLRESDMCIVVSPCPVFPTHMGCRRQISDTINLKY